MDNNTSGSRKLFLKPAKSFQKLDTNGTENGSPSNNVLNLGNNPFLKCEEKDEEALKNHKSTDAVSNLNEKTDELFKPAKKNLNLFTSSKTLSENSNFVFGQNLHERVVTDKTPPIESTSKKSDDESNSNLLFSSALSSSSITSTADETNDKTDQIKDANSQSADKKKSNENDKEDSSTKSSNDNSLSLVEAARRYEEMKGAQKRKYEEVEVKTGEEDEKNILEMNCKLFTFDKNNWEERGRGMLRLNDSKNSSRVVFRSMGNYRVLLNTKVWKDQVCEQPSSKSLRLTAFDTAGLLKIYLVMGKNEDVENLYHYLSTRIQREKDKVPEIDEEEKEEENSLPEAQDVNDEDKEASPEPASKKLAVSDE